MRVALCVLVIACGTPAKPVPVKQAPPPVPIDAAIVEPDAQAPVVHRDPPRRLIEAPPGGAIEEIAVTGDGLAVITADELGGLRLWPRLDGSVEPRVVDLARPRALAIGKRGDKFAVAGIDEVGGLQIALLDGDGRTVQHASQFNDLAFGDLVMTPRGPLATRSDQTLVQLDDNGAVVERLGIEPGQKLVGIEIAGGRPYALIEKHRLDPVPDVDAGVGLPPTKEVFPRWIATEPQLHWGDWIDAGSPLGPVIAISPSGKRLAAILREKNQTLHVVVFDLTTKQPIAEQVPSAATQLAFIDEDHIAFGPSASVGWLDIAKLPKVADMSKLEPAPVRTPRARLETAAGTAIAAHSGELVIATPKQTRYLGYQLEAPHVAAAAPGGQLMIGVGDTFSLLDDKLHEIAQPTNLVPRNAAVAQLRHLEGELWLVESAYNDGTQLAIVDVKSGATSMVRTKMPVVHTLAYEPSTHLVTLSYGDTPEIDRYDPVHHKLDKVIALPQPKTFEQRRLEPVQPALAGGTQVVYVQQKDRTSIRWLHDPAQLDRGASVDPDGSVAGVDGAGRVYMWQNNAPASGLKLTIYFEGKEVGRVPTDGSMVLWPEPKGTRLLAQAQRSVAMLGLDGAKRWVLPLEGGTEALWLDDGAVVIVSNGGLARIDANTGTVMAARCGWRFGLATRPHPVTPRIEPVCAQLLGN